MQPEHMRRDRCIYVTSLTRWSLNWIRIIVPNTVGGVAYALACRAGNTYRIRAIGVAICARARRGPERILGCFAGG